MRDSKRCVHTLAHNHSYSKDCCFSRKRGREVTASKAKVTLSHLSAAGKCVHDREIQWAPEATACTLNMVHPGMLDIHTQLWMKPSVTW